MADGKSLYRLNYLEAYRCSFNNHHITHCLQGTLRPCFGFLIKGRCTLNARGVFDSAQAGQLIHIPKRLGYVSEWFGEPDVEFYGVAYDFDDINEAYELQRVNGVDEQRVGRLMEQMYGANDEKDGILLLESLFFDFYRSVKPHLAQRTGNASEYSIRKGKQYISEHFLESFPMKNAAESCGLSESRFYHIFRNAVGMTPVEYRTSLRIRYASELLESKSYSVEQVCGMSGFSSSAFFRESFKRYTGVNPKDYARKKREI